MTEQEKQNEVAAANQAIIDGLPSYGHKITLAEFGGATALKSQDIVRDLFEMGFLEYSQGGYTLTTKGERIRHALREQFGMNGTKEETQEPAEDGES